MSFAKDKKDERTIFMGKMSNSKFSFQLCRNSQQFKRNYIRLNLAQGQSKDNFSHIMQGRDTIKQSHKRKG